MKKAEILPVGKVHWCPFIDREIEMVAGEPICKKVENGLSEAENINIVAEVLNVENEPH